LGELSDERGSSRLGREEEVGVGMRGTRRPLTEVSRGLVIEDIFYRNVTNWPSKSLMKEQLNSCSNVYC
jgi:hypothetical protein